MIDPHPSDPQLDRGSRHSPLHKNRYYQINEMLSEEKDPRIINHKLSPLIKDYKQRAIYE